MRLRQSEQSKSVGYRVRQGLEKAKKTNRGRMPRYLLSGLLECPDCGGGYTIVSRGHYGCSTHRNGGAAACPNATQFKRVDAENALLAGLKERLLTDASVEYARKAIVKIVRERSKAKPPSDNRWQALEEEIANLSDAIVDGALKSSPAIVERLHERLRKAKTALSALQEVPELPAMQDVELELTRVVAKHKAFVADLARTLTKVDVHQARTTLKSMYGTVRARQEGATAHLEVESGRLEAAALTAAGARTAARMVAGGLTEIRNSREFCGRPDRHPYELFLQLEEIQHHTTKVNRPQSNGFVERLHRTLLDEHFRVRGRRKWCEIVEEMQAALDAYLPATSPSGPTRSVP